MILPQNPRDRESIDGSNHDGFRQKATLNTVERGQIPMRHGQTSLIPSRTIEKWLDKKATDKQREAFAEVFTAIHDYDQNTSFFGDAIVDHTDNSFSRLVSHLPYDVAGTINSTVNRNRRKKRRSHSRRSSVNEELSSSESSSSDSDNYSRTRDRRSVRKRERRARGSDSDDSDHGYSSNRRSRKKHINDRRSSPKRRRGGKYDSSDDNESHVSRRHTTKKRGGSRRSSQRNRYQYSSDSD